MPDELNDYSGSYKADLQFSDFSKPALIRLLRAYRTIFVGMMGTWNTVNRRRMSVDEAFELDADVYEEQLRNFEVPLLKQAMNIEGDDVETLLKIFQMCPDGAGEDFYEFDHDLKNSDHAVLTFTQCPTLSYFESKGSTKDIECLCGPGGVEDRAFIEFCKIMNPKMKCTAIHVPPREDKDGVCCQWEFKVDREAPDDAVIPSRSV
ncbi:MAG: hypothetical protein HOC23_14560 [Halieaceae bacterium]|jgi:hypothetical protein|nr:hypothetical protein [Halieaceae bacterium]